MMRTFVLACSLAAALTPAFAFAQTPPAPAASPKPLRHLSYELSFNSVVRIEQLNSGLDPGNANGAHDSVGIPTKGTSTLEVDVIAATGDRGLVVDAQVVGAERKAPKVRFGITSDGKLLFDPKAGVIEEEVRLLPLLAQGAFDHTIEPGAVWEKPIAAGDASGKTTYHIYKTDGDRISAEIAQALTVKGAAPYTETSRLLTDYDLHYVTPLDGELQVHVQGRGGAGQTRYVDTDIHLKLSGDTLGAKP